MDPERPAAGAVAAAPGPTLLASRTRTPAERACKGKAAAAAAPAPAPHYAAAWAEAAGRFGDLDALVFDGIGSEHRFTFESLERSANRLARGLSVMGVGVGDRLVTIVDNRPELVVLLLSCLKLGVTFVPLATDLRPCDCRGMVARYEPSLIVCDQMQCAPFAHKDGGNYRSIVLPPFEGHDNQLKQMMSEGSDQPIQMPDVPAGVPSIIFSTSGSTALPKGVMYSHADLAGLGSGGGPWPDSVVGACTKHLMWVSMRGVGGTVMLLTHLLQGATTVMVDSYPSGPEIWGRLIEKHGLESHILFGAALNQTLQEMPGHKFESVRTIFYGGCCFAPTLIQRSMEQFPNATFVQGYGMTEVGPISILGGDFHKRAGEASEQDVLRMSSAGRILAPGSVFIEDLDQPGSGKAPPPGKDGVGQVCARCSVTMMGYFADPEKTLEAMPDGKFVRTGDVGRIDEDGFIYILGRVKDIIPAYKGFNVTPRDVEEVLYSHACVGEASVVGVWHPSGAGEAVVAWTRAKTGAHLRADDLRGHLERAGVPHWQLPDAIHVAHQPLPTTGSKIDTKALRAPAFRQAQLAAELAAAHSRRRAGGPAPGSAGRALQAEALVSELCRSGEALHADRLAAVFGDSLPAARTAMGDEARRAGLLEALEGMDGEEHESFLLGVRSLLANWAAGKLAA